MDTPVDLLALLRSARRSASGRNKVVLALYGLLCLVPLCLLVVAAGRAALGGTFGDEVATVFLRPVKASAGFFQDALHAGRIGTAFAVAVGFWVASVLVGSFFGLALTRLAAIELTSARRAHVGEALRFARKHWTWALVTRLSLFCAAILLLGLALLMLMTGRWAEWLLLIAVPAAFVAVLMAAFLLIGLGVGGILAAPTIATEWSDAFDAISRVYGYGFGHIFRVVVYRLFFGLVFVIAAAARLFRAGVVLVLFYIVLLLGLGKEPTNALVDSVLLEAPQARPFPHGIAAWVIMLSVSAYLTWTVARLLVFRRVLHEALYLLLRYRVDKIPMHKIDGYRPDDSAFDPTAQGFELVEVEEEIRAED